MSGKFTIIFCFVASLVTADANFNDVNAQYFIGTFNSDYFPLSIGTCNPLTVLSSSGFQKATCIDENTLYWESFSGSDDTCSNDAASAIEYNSTFKTGLGTPNDFQCDDDGTDSYASIEVSLNTCDTMTTTVRMNAAVGVCTLANSGDSINLIAYCQENYAELQYHVSSSDDQALCQESSLYAMANASHECGFIVQTNGISVYGTMAGCVLDGECVGGSDCPTTTGEGNAAVSTDNGSDSDSDDNTIYDSDDTGEDDSSYQDYYSMVASLDITVSRIWNDRNDVWAILKRAYRYILANYGDYIEDNVHLFINDWSVTVVNDDDTGDDSTGDDDDDDDSYVESLQFTFTITLYDDDGDNMEDWYGYLISLASEFEDDYQTNCMDISTGYKPSGFGSVTVNSASLAYYDENGDTVDSATYDSGNTVYSSSDAYATSIHGMAWVCVMFVSMFVAVFG